MEQTVWILLCIGLILVGIYMLYRYIETSRIIKLMEKKKSLYISGKSKVKNHSFFLVSSFLIFCLSGGMAMKIINADKRIVNTTVSSKEMKDRNGGGYSMDQAPVGYDVAPEMAMNDNEQDQEGITECKTVEDAKAEMQLLNAVNSLLSKTEDVRFGTMNAVTLVTYSFDEEAIANYLVEGQELNIYQEGEEYYVEVRQVYRLEEVVEAEAKTE